MNIVIIGGGFFNQALRNLGHNIYHVDFGQNADWSVGHPFTTAGLAHKLAQASFSPDILFYCDNGNLPYLFDPQNIPYPNVWYSIDTYCNPWHIPYGHGFDLTVVAQKDFVPLFTNEGIRAFWLPLFCRESLANQTFTIERDVPVSFVGNVGHKNNPERLPFLKNFKRIHPLVMHVGDFVPIFTRSQIVLNQLAFAEVNFRCFEVMACGAALLTETCANGLDELFKIGEEILPTYTHNDARMAANIAKDFLARPNELTAIAKAGQKAVLERHTDLVRSKWLLGECALLLQNKGQSKRLTDELGRRTTLVASAFGILAAEVKNKEQQACYEKIFRRAIS